MPAVRTCPAGRGVVRLGAVGLLAVVAACSGGRVAARPGNPGTTAPPGRAPTTTTRPAAPTTAAPSEVSNAPVAPITSVPAADGTVGAPGIGDGLFPTSGNGGIDVAHYDLALTPTPDRTGFATATVTLTLTATVALTRFDLDLDGLTVDAVTVDGRPATWQHQDAELMITPVQPLAAGAPVTVAVTYHGQPRPGQVSYGAVAGWVAGTHGSYTLNEPDVGRTWFPSNDHPSDKATFTIRVTVPDDVTAVANGRLVDKQADAGRLTWVWDETAPMATYLVQVAVGDYEIRTADGPNGIQLRNVALKSDLASVSPCFDAAPAMLTFFADRFGPYPFAVYGILAAESTPGVAMESQTLSLFSRDDLRGRCPETVLSHELAHQWFGDAVTPARWQDIWLNEGFATYAQELWDTKDDVAAITADARRATGGRWSPPAAPTAAGLFGSSSYEGGGAVLQALRLEVGDDTFFAVLKAWVATYSGRSATTDDFVVLVASKAGQPAADHLHGWLTTDQGPTFP